MQQRHYKYHYLMWRGMSSLTPLEPSPSEKSLPTQTKSSRSSPISSLIANLEKGIFVPDQATPVEKWQLRKIKDLTRPTESGISTQFKVVLQNDNFQIYGRLKFIKNLNEAIFYDKMQANNDPLHAYTPKFLGVLDSKGNVIDLRQEIAQHGEAFVLVKYKPAYIILRDLLSDLEEGTKLNGDPQDYKFAKPSLLGNESEVKKHDQTRHNALKRGFREKFLSLSGCSFAYQGTVKGGWAMWVINGIRRALRVSKTKSELHKNFNKMEAAELAHNMRSLAKFKQALRNSNFTSADSSLLFIPTTTTRNGRVKFNIEIKLIDFSHGLERTENIEGFSKMQGDMVNSIQELIDFMREIYLRKAHAARRTYNDL